MSRSDRSRRHSLDLGQLFEFFDQAYPSTSTSRGGPKSNMWENLRGSLTNLASRQAQPTYGPVPSTAYETGILHPPDPDWRQRYQGWGDIGSQHQQHGDTHLLGFLGAEEALPKDELNFCKSQGIEFNKKIGSGGFGTVWSTTVTNQDTGVARQLACKVLQISAFGAPARILFLDIPADVSLNKAVEYMTQEADALHNLDHKNLVVLDHVFNIHDQATGFPFVRLLLFMELCDGDLKALAKNYKKNKLPEDVLRSMIAQVSEGLRYLHEEHNLCHFDIKPHNIMYINQPPGGQFIFKLGDFGLAKRFLPGDPDPLGVRGTIFYKAPEMSETETYEPKPTDVYSLGVVFAEGLTGSIGFTMSLCLNWIRRTKWDVEKDGIAEYYELSTEGMDLLRLMTVEDPRDRATINEVCTHSWVTGQAAQQQQAGGAQTAAQALGADDQAQGPIVQGQGAIDQGQGANDQGQGAIDQGQGAIDQGQGANYQGQGAIAQGQGAIPQAQGAIPQRKGDDDLLDWLDVPD